MKKFSIIVPVYRQGATIHRDITALLGAMEDSNMPFEIIAVVDGYLDTSREEMQKIHDKHLHVVGYPTNHGKGYAVRYGFAKATGDVIGFMDAGGDLKPTSLHLMLEQFLFLDADAVIGSKRHPDSKIEYPAYRKVVSSIYQLIVRLLFGLNVRDTQVGMKIYRRKVLEDVLPRLLVKEFAFDIEILAVMWHLGYRKIYEAPIDIDFHSVLSSINLQNLFRVGFRTLWDTVAVFYRLRLRHYYDNESHRKWKFDPELNFRINVG
jgi:glycosyltransferase involved in cell wall biosynthesis